MIRFTLPGLAVLLVTAVLGVQLAAGGGRYVPIHSANPCTPRPVAPIPTRLDPLAGEIVLLGLDGAACRLGISRERLVLALAETHKLTPRQAAALKAGLGDAVDRLKRAHLLPAVSRLLPEAVGQAHIPGVIKTIIEAIPDGVVNDLLPTAPLLHQTVNELDINRVLHELTDRRQLDQALQSAILRAVLHQILGRLYP